MNMAARSLPDLAAMSMLANSSAISCWSISPFPAISAIVSRGFLEVSIFLRRSAGAASAFTFASMNVTKSCVAWSMPSSCSRRSLSGVESTTCSFTCAKNSGVREGRTRVISNSSSLISVSRRYWSSSRGSEGMVRELRNSSSSALRRSRSARSSSSFAFFCSNSRSAILLSMMPSSGTTSGISFSGSQASSKESSSSSVSSCAT
mmetsp:Transcript_1432/g.2867  ORF Transcript_1432/g.2867 Transcript_1432/m.2867 type:complete len:205 (+) Transcript_1432:850-1464(+)